MTTVFLLCAACAYIGAAVLIAKQSLSQAVTQLYRSPLVFCLVLIAIGIHGYVLNAELFNLAQADFSMINIANLLAWSMVLVLIVAGSLLQNLNLLPVTLGFAGLCALLMLINPNSQPLTELQHAGTLLHIAMSLTAYGCVVVALLYAYQMRYIHKQLKAKSTAMQTLPPLLQVEAWVYRLIGIGSILLAFSLFSGFATSDTMLSQQHAHKTVLSSAALAVFFAVLMLHKRTGLTNKTLLSLTSVGVILLTIGYFGSRIVREFIL